MPTLVVYGATSYTATQHLLPYLATHPEADKFELVLAGRNAGRLEAANALLPGSTRKIVALTLEDTAAVEGLVGRADGVINLAGEWVEAGWDPRSRKQEAVGISKLGMCSASCGCSTWLHVHAG